jgi:FKBP-type peptidyl-prolyl cis-trans isomerase FkpA
MKKILFLLFIPLFIFSCKKDDTVTAEEQAAIDKGIIQKYIKDHSLIADSTTSGLYYVIADSGIGTTYPNLNSYLYVYYKGYLTDGSIFDQNTAGQPLQIFLNQTIAGWKEGIPKIKKKGKIKLLIPSALGYGSTVQTDIPANSVLIFDVELDNF